MERKLGPLKPWQIAVVNATAIGSFLSVLACNHPASATTQENTRTGPNLKPTPELTDKFFIPIPPPNTNLIITHASYDGRDGSSTYKFVLPEILSSDRSRQLMITEGTFSYNLSPRGLNGNSHQGFYPPEGDPTPLPIGAFQRMYIDQLDSLVVDIVIFVRESSNLDRQRDFLDQDPMTNPRLTVKKSYNIPRYNPNRLYSWILAWQRWQAVSLGPLDTIPQFPPTPQPPDPDLDPGRIT